MFWRDASAYEFVFLNICIYVECNIYICLRIRLNRRFERNGALWVLCF